MQPSGEMQSFVNACELKHKTYLDEPGAKLKMKLNSRDLPLVLERTAPNIVRVAHEVVDSNGQLVYDPEVLFFTGYEKWIAMEINQPGGLFTEVGRRSHRKRYVTLNATETAVKEYKVAKQKELAAFVKYWVRLLRSRGWHEDSTDALYQQTSFLPDDSYDDDDDGQGAADPNHPGLRLMDAMADLAENKGLMTDELRESYKRARPGRTPGHHPVEPLHQDDEDEEDKDEDDEGEASTARLRDHLGDLLDSEGLLADEPARPRRGRGTGIESITISSGKKSVTLTGKNHL